MSESFWDESHTVEEFGRSYYLHGAEQVFCRKYFPRGGLVLDLGCGAGRTTLLLHEAGYRIVGVDLSFRMASHIKCRFPYLRSMTANAAELPFASDVFDGVLFSYNGISFVYPKETRNCAISEIQRVLKPGGSFIFSAHNKIGIVLNLRDRGFRTIPERWFTLRNLFGKGYAYEKGIKSQVYYSSVRDLIKEMESHGFQWQQTLDRHGRFGLAFARWFDPWPYHCFRKAGS